MRLTLALLGVLSVAHAEAPLSLTLERALQLTESANATVLLGREAAAQAVAQADQQRVNVLPNIALRAQQGRSETVSITSNAPVQSAPGNRYDGKITGSFSLLNPQQLASWRASRAGAAAASFDAQAILQSSLATVAQAYFTHLRNLRRIEVLDANTARAQKLFKLAESLLAGGVATPIDVTRADALVAQAQLARLQHQTTVMASALALQRLLDLDVGRSLELQNFNVRRVAEGEFVFGRERTAFERRADLLKTQKALDQAKLDVRAARFEQLPSLLITGEYGHAAAEFDQKGRKKAWSTAAAVSVPLFDGLRSNADRRLALSRQRSQELRLRDLKQQISAELRLATQDADSRHAQIAVAEKSLRLAEDEMRLAENRFRAGAADNREMIEAQNRLAVADDGLVDAVYQYNLARVALAYVKGDVREVLKERVE